MEQQEVNWEEIDRCPIWKTLGVVECSYCDSTEACWGKNINLPEPEKENVWNPKGTVTPPRLKKGRNYAL